MRYDDERPQRLRPLLTDAIAIAAIAFVGAAALAVLSWTRPSTTTRVAHYSQTGRLTYEAPASPTSIYGSAGVHSGQPVYSTVVATLHLTYTYHFVTAHAGKASGTEQLVATVTKGTGITHVVPLQPSTPFTGDHFRAAGVLSFAALNAAVEHFRSTSGNSVTTTTYTVVVSPRVKLDTRLTGTELRARFDPATKFAYSSGDLALSSATAPAAASAGPTKTGANDLRSTASGSATVPNGAANRLLGFAVADLRIASLVLVALAATALFLLLRPLITDFTSEDERVRIAVRHRSSLVEVRALPAIRSVVHVELHTFTGLSTIANKLECPILHLGDDLGDAYAVVDNGTLYQYRIDRLDPERANRLSSGSPRHAPPEPALSATRARES